MPASGDPADAGGPAVMASPAGGGVVLDDGLDSKGPAVAATAANPPVAMPTGGPAGNAFAAGGAGAPLPPGMVEAQQAGANIPGAPATAAGVPVAGAPGTAVAVPIPAAPTAGAPTGPAFAAGAPPAGAPPAAPPGLTFTAGPPEDDIATTAADTIPTTAADNVPVAAPPGAVLGATPPPFGVGAQEQAGAAAPPATAAVPPGGARRRSKADDDSTAPGEAPAPVYNPAGAPPTAAGFPPTAGGIPGVNVPLAGAPTFGTGADDVGAFAPGVAGQPGQAGTIEIKRGSAEEVTTTFLALLAAGDMEQAVTLISGRATGILAKLREGTASDEDIQRLREAAASTDMTSRPKGGSHVQFSVKSEKTILLIEADQKEEGSSIMKLDMRDAPRKRGNR